MLKSDALRYFLWILVVLTFGGNLFALLMRRMGKDENKVQNLFICSLSISDMLMGIYLAGIINKEMTTRGSYYLYDLNWRSGRACHAFGVISVISSEVSVFTLVFIAYDRFLHIVRALDFKEIVYSTAVILLIITWVACTIIAILPALVQPYFFDKSKDVAFYGTSSICLPLQLPGEGATAWEYCLAVFGLLNFFAAIYLIVTYIRMFYSSYKSAQESGNTKRLDVQPALAKRFAVIIFTDVCCWVPIAMLLFLSLGRAVSDSDNVLYAVFSICVIPINSAINPILYTIGTPFFWDKIKGYLVRITSHCKAGRRRQGGRGSPAQETEQALGHVEQCKTTDHEEEEVVEKQSNCSDLITKSEEISQKTKEIKISEGSFTGLPEIPEVSIGFEGNVGEKKSADTDHAIM